MVVDGFLRVTERLAVCREFCTKVELLRCNGDPPRSAKTVSQTTYSENYRKVTNYRHVHVPVQTGNLYINKVIQKAIIEVKETGTVAAAATAIGLHPLVVMQPPTEVFTADHPFIHFLRDKQTGAILFQGKFTG